jgi:hypothetical protein
VAGDEDVLGRVRDQPRGGGVEILLRLRAQLLGVGAEVDVAGRRQRPVARRERVARRHRVRRLEVRLRRRRRARALTVVAARHGERGGEDEGARLHGVSS